MHSTPKPLQGTGPLLRLLLSFVLFAALSIALCTAASAEGLLPGFPGLEKEDLYYRRLLSEEPNGEALVQIFDKMYDSIMNFDSSCTFVYDEAFGYDDVKTVYSLVRREPAGAILASGSGSRSGRQYTMNFDYCSGVYTDRTKRSELIKASVELLADAGITSRNVTKLSDVEKVRRIHDALVTSVTYGSTVTNGQTAYSAIVKNESVCAGYSKAMQFLLAECGVEALYVSGHGNGEKHAWNIVKEDENWYCVDVTWDDPGDGDISYDYFNISTELLLWDHKPAACVFGYPDAPDSGWSPVPALTGEVSLSLLPGGRLTLSDISVSEGSGALYAIWIVNGKIGGSWTGLTSSVPQYDFSGNGSVKTLQLCIASANCSRYIRSEVFNVR